MIDTVRFGIPLTYQEWSYLNALATVEAEWVPALYNPESGGVWMRRLRGLIHKQQQSHEGDIRWDIPGHVPEPVQDRRSKVQKAMTPFPEREEPIFLCVELSLPKFMYGDNIRLLHNWQGALDRLQEILNKSLRPKGSRRFGPWQEWTLIRVDPCYAWKFPSQELAQSYLDSLKRHPYPNKKRTIYDTTIMFAGDTYSAKFYLKHPEFVVNDKKKLKRGVRLEYVDLLESHASGVLRFEATLRQKYLRRNGIETLGDLTTESMEIVFPDDMHPGDNPTDNMLRWCGFQAAIMVGEETGEVDPENLYDGQVLTLPEGMTVECNYEDEPDNIFQYKHKAGWKFEVSVYSLTGLLQRLLRNFAGENGGMDYLDVVEQKLLNAYQPVKAARLTSMWIYIQKFGALKARQSFGENSYYRAKREMRDAGVELIETPENVKIIDRSFLERFKLALPSPFAVNSADGVIVMVEDFRDGQGVLNISG
jgi:hypothetical protein